MLVKLKLGYSADVKHILEITFLALLSRVKQVCVGFTFPLYDIGVSVSLTTMFVCRNRGAVWVTHERGEREQTWELYRCMAEVDALCGECSENIYRNQSRWPLCNVKICVESLCLLAASSPECLSQVWLFLSRIILSPTSLRGQELPRDMLNKNHMTAHYPIFGCLCLS